jgi:HAAS domain-containing protein
MPEPDRIDGYLARVERDLHVHGRRRRRIMEELEAHLRESAERNGSGQAIARMGPAAQVAASFTPRPADRLWEQRDRLAALALLGAMLASLQLAYELHRLLGLVGSDALWPFLALLAPTAAVAVASAVLVLCRRPLGARLALPLLAMTLLTAAVTVPGLPPAGAAFSGYRQAVSQGYESSGCDGRSLAACAGDHASEIRLNFSAGAVALATVYFLAVAGSARERRRWAASAA